MLIFAYRQDGATLSHNALLAWCRAQVVSGISAITFPGTVATFTPPSLPWSFEQQIVADDRETLGGEVYSLIRYVARSGTWSFAEVPESELTQWRSWYAATQGGRLPFILAFRDTLHVVKAPGAFPLAMIRAERWGGQLTIREVLD